MDQQWTTVPEWQPAAWWCATCGTEGEWHVGSRAAHDVAQWDPTRAASTCGDLLCSRDEQEIGIHPQLRPCDGAAVVAPWVRRAAAATLPAKEYAR